TAMFDGVPDILFNNVLQHRRTDKTADVMPELLFPDMPVISPDIRPPDKTRALCQRLRYFCQRVPAAPVSRSMDTPALQGQQVLNFQC
uniref:hypothetical protein n=1 Tax=Escherichia coli TaxID=562 RepID=UPI001BDCC7BD